MREIIYNLYYFEVIYSGFSYLFGYCGEHLIVIRNDGLKTKFLELCARLANLCAFKWSELQRHCFSQGLMDIVSGYIAIQL